MPVELLMKLPKKARNMWESVYSAAKEKYGEKRAAKIAWIAVKKKFKKVNNKWVAKTSDFESFTTIHYEFVADKATVTKSDDGYTYIDYVLSTNEWDAHNQRFGALALKSFADTINLEGVVGPIEDQHYLMNELKSRGLTPEEIEEYMNGMNTGIKAVKAVYDPKGKVIATIQVRNDLVSEVLKYKGASVEARFPLESYRAGEITQAKLSSFILTNNPANPSALSVAA